jgi:predicted amino acid-binding ACT domain protein
MDHHAVLTAIGADRPGLVDEVSAYVLERGGNLEDSRMLNLHGQFAMMMLVSVAGRDRALTRTSTSCGPRAHSRQPGQGRHVAGGSAQAPSPPVRLGDGPSGLVR